jgi:hypothetical protein
MRRLVITALFFVAGGSLLAGAGLRQAGASEPGVQVAIDVDVAGNGDSVLGPTESCNATPLQVGGTIDVDVVVRGVPEYVPDDPIAHTDNSGGIVGYEFNVRFDPVILRLDLVHALDGPSILKGGGDPLPFVWKDYNWHPDDAAEGPPGTTGNSLAAVVDLSGVYESGDGVLTRLTFTAVGGGVSSIYLQDELWPLIEPPTIIDSTSEPYPVTADDALVIVGAGNCSDASPTRSATPTPPPGPTTPARESPQTPTRTHVFPTMTAPRTPTPTTAAPTPTPTLAPTATVTPRELPRAGGASQGGSVSVAWVLIFGGLLAMAGSFALARGGCKC